MANNRLWVILGFMAVCCAGYAEGAPPKQLPEPVNGQLLDRISADQAASRVRKQTGGRVLGVETDDQRHRVKVLTPKGEVRRVLVPSRNR